MKSYLRLTVSAMALAMFANIAVAEDDVRLRLNWMYYGSHAGFALGKDQGHYKDSGINIDIRSGNGSSSAHRLVANGDSDFCLRLMCSYGNTCGSRRTTGLSWCY